MTGPRCTVCAHPAGVLIDQQLHGGRSILKMAKEFGLTRDSLMRHRDRHAATQPEPVPPPTPPLPPLTQRGTPRRVRRPALANARADFLEAFRMTGNVTKSAEKAGTTRLTVRTWQELDEHFAIEYQQAEIEAVERLEGEARERAVKGTKMLRRVIRGGRVIEEVEEYRPSDAMLIKLLQALRPEKYGDKLSVTQTTIVKTVDSEMWEAV